MVTAASRRCAALAGTTAAVALLLLLLPVGTSAKLVEVYLEVKWQYKSRE